MSGKKQGGCACCRCYLLLLVADTPDCSFLSFGGKESCTESTCIPDPCRASPAQPLPSPPEAHRLAPWLAFHTIVPLCLDISQKKPAGGCECWHRRGQAAMRPASAHSSLCGQIFIARHRRARLASEIFWLFLGFLVLHLVFSCAKVK